jgi:hypothetical protein
MNIHNHTIINQLLQAWPQGTAATTRWLEQQKVSRQLQFQYQKSGWIEAIGVGAFKRAGGQIGWKGGFYALQTQLHLPIHVGGLTAIILQGAGHYVRFKEEIQLFGPPQIWPPKWFKDYAWEEKITFHRTGFLPESLGLTSYEDKTFSVGISSLERAVLEALYLAPKQVDIVECFHLLEGLAGLRPDLLQELLEHCASVKVKRLFFYLAEKTKHDWLSFIDVKKIDLGIGKRSLVKSGIYDSKYQLTLPKELHAL